MNFAFIDQLPMWSSLALTVIGLFISLWLVRLAYGGVLFTFTILLTAGILVFGVHHLAELLLPPHDVVSEGLEAISSFIFLTAAIYLPYRLKRIIDGP